MAVSKTHELASLSILRRTRPIWMGIGIGVIFMVFFLIVGNVKEGETFSYYQEGPDGTSGFVSVPYSSIPFTMPMFGFFLGLLVYLRKKAKSTPVT